ARALGFHRVGIAAVSPAERHAVYEAWVAAGHAGAMAYMTDAASRSARRDVRSLLPSARTIVAVALSYASPARHGAEEAARGGIIARYASGADYHLVMKSKLALLADELAGAAAAPISFRVCVDTAPVLERDLAERTGLGFGGKNTLIIAPGLGS